MMEILGYAAGALIVLMVLGYVFRRDRKCPLCEGVGFNVYMFYTGSRYKMCTKCGTVWYP